MSSKTRKAGATSKAADAEPDATLSISQDQLQALIRLTDVVFKGAEEMHRCQMEAAHQAHERHEQAQALVAQARTTAELFELQAGLLRFDLEASSQYWQRIATICAETQASSLSLLNQSAATVGGDLAKLVAQPVATPAARPQPEPAPELHGSEAAHQVWNQWVDLGKQWADMVYRTEASLH
ncbi:MAG TPA: phasin family protein [Rhizobacter sp.]|nr:phasin family protein [Rhizobacter sp.]